MKLNLNFDKYKGTTRLKQWWKEVKAHFTQVQEAHNALEDTVAAESEKLSTEITQRTNADIALSDRITAEANTRSNADTALGQRITAEENARATADTTIQQNINAEADNRQTADNDLQQKITAETTARKTADIALIDRITAVEEKAHTHTNKTVLDGISAADIDAWNSIKEQVTQAQLDAVKAYLEEMCFGFSDEFQRIYTAMGVTVYDGGIFGMKQSEIAIDGGDFADEITGTVDCGGFEPIIISTETGAVIDGGEY